MDYQHKPIIKNTDNTTMQMIITKMVMAIHTTITEIQMRI
jgi:hypothetical protein